jgi:hypothetical protein
MLRQGSVKTLIRLVEDKLSFIAVIDREDKREKRLLESCRDELWNMLLSKEPAQSTPPQIA